RLIYLFHFLLSAGPCPEFRFSHFFRSRRKQINLMEPFPFTHFHDFFFEMLQKLISRSVLSSCLVVTGLSHVALPGCIIFSNAVDHNMGMDISGMITSVHVSNNESLISRKYFPGQFHRKFLCSLS